MNVFDFEFPNVDNNENEPMDKYLIVRVIDKNNVVKDEGLFVSMNINRSSCWICYGTTIWDEPKGRKNDKKDIRITGS